MVGRAPRRDSPRWPSDSRIHVTGTVDDVRPYLWKSAVSIVPLRIGGGTRLKIYEAMAAKIPVVSTSVGAEGLDVRDGENIADRRFARSFRGALRGLAQRTRKRAGSSPKRPGKWSLHVILGR